MNRYLKPMTYHFLQVMMAVALGMGINANYGGPANRESGLQGPLLILFSIYVILGGIQVWVLVRDINRASADEQGQTSTPPPGR